jgi:uncharacterized membrane protein
MALVTLACRCGGYFIFSRLKPSLFLQSALDNLPGCIFIAYVVPALQRGTPETWLGAAVTIATMILSRNIGASIVAGVAAAWGATALL